MREVLARPWVGVRVCHLLYLFQGILACIVMLLLDIRAGHITMAEDKKSLKALKKGKAAGCDNIPPEAWKEGALVSAKVLHSLLNKIWNEENIPHDWTLVKLSKKGDLSLCKNWRGIMLLSVASKVPYKIALEGMKNALEVRLRDYARRDPAMT